MSCCCKHESGSAKTPVLAVIMDLDGTLLNTEKATKGILKEFLKKFGKVLDSEKEDSRLGMMHKESTTSIVKDYDLPMTPDQFSKEIMPLFYERWPLAKPLPGADRLIRHLRKHGVPLALASNSKTENVEKKISNQQGWKESFLTVLGSDQVNSGKPSPDIFLEAAKRLGVDAANCLVIEDSLVGVTAGKAAGMKVVAVPSLPAQAGRYTIADTVLHSLLEFQPEFWGLPAFEDCTFLFSYSVILTYIPSFRNELSHYVLMVTGVGDALPIEPMYVKGLLQKGFLCETIDDGPAALPDQVMGGYFGWARLSTNKIVKVVLSIAWQNQFAAKRVIRTHLIGESDKYLSGQQLQLLIVGYIDGPSSKVNTTMDSEIPEEDITIANEALDLPMFLHHKSSPLLEEAAFADGTADLNHKE